MRLNRVLRERLQTLLDNAEPSDSDKLLSNLLATLREVSGTVRQMYDELATEFKADGKNVSSVLIVGESTIRFPSDEPGTICIPIQGWFASNGGDSSLQFQAIQPYQKALNDLLSLLNRNTLYSHLLQH